MAKWMKIVSGFDGEDETKNFGTRNFAESNGSIYETWTLATIQSDSEVTENPKIAATFSHGKLSVAVDSCITIFNDQSCNDILSTVVFDTPVTSHCLSSDGSFLFATVEPAKLHCFFLLLGARTLFCIDFRQKYQCERIIKIYLHEVDNILDLIIIASNGNIFQIKGIDQNVEQNLKECPKYYENTIELLSTNRQLEYVISLNSNDNELQNSSTMVLMGNDELSIWPHGTSCYINNSRCKYKKMQFVYNNRAMLCLRSDGSLNLLSHHSWLTKKVFTGPVVDFIVLPDKSQDTYNLLVLMAEKNNQSLLHLMSFPDFNIIYTMCVPTTTYLVDIVDETLDHLIYLEGMKNSQEFVNTIRVKAIEESMPEYRLQRLLRKGRYEDALAFTKKFRLNIESVYRAEAQALIHRLRPRANNTNNTEIAVLFSVLDKITDVKYIYECCNNALTRNSSDIRQLFNYTRQRISEHINTLNNTEVSTGDLDELLLNVSNTTRKLETFEMIQRLQAMKNSTIVDIDEWMEFSHADLLDECIKNLSLGDMDVATLIWTRHASCIARTITKDTVRKILDAITGNLAPTQLLPWLQHFIPSITTFLPDVLPNIIDWAYKKTKSLEKLYRDSWPDIGLDFAKQIIELLHFDEYNVCFQFHQQYTNKNSEFHRLTMLLQAMTDLHQLKMGYKIIVPLNTYLGNTTDVVTLLLDKVHVDDISRLLQNFLEQYLLKHSLQHDTILSTYITNTLRNTKDWWLWDKAPWDKRLAVVIGSIHNIQNRLQMTIEVLKKAPVPWSESLMALAEQSRSCDHPLMTKIQIEINRVAFKLIMKKYGFARVGLCMKLFQYIIKEDRPSMIEDIIELTKTQQNLRLQVFYNCIKYHLINGNIAKVSSIMLELSDDMLLNCCLHLINVIKGKLNAKHDDSLKYYFEILGFVEAQLKRILANDNTQWLIKFKDTLADIPRLRVYYCLKEEFNIIINYQDFYLYREDVILNYIEKSITQEEVNWPRFHRKIQRINNLLDLPKFFGLYQLLCRRKGCVNLKNYIINYLNDCTIIFAEECYYLNKICSLLVSSPHDDSRMATCLSDLYSRILISDDITNLSSNLIIANRIDAYNEAVGTQENKIDNTESSKLELSNIYKIYKDVSVVGENVLIPLLQDLLELSAFYQANSNANTRNYEMKERDIKPQCKNLLEKVQAMQNEFHDFSLLKIIVTFRVELGTRLPISQSAMTNIQSVLSHCLLMMLRKVISNRVFDLHLGLACLFMLPQHEAMNAIETVLRISEADHARHRIITALACEYCRLCNNGLGKKFETQKILHCWAQRLVAYDIPYRDTLTNTMDKNRSTMRRLMLSKKSEVIDLLEEFCYTFGFDTDYCFMSYIETLLSSWQPKYDENSIAENHGHLKIDTTDIKELTKFCKQIIQHIKNTEALNHHLNEIKSQINFYHYEIFLIIFELNQQRNIEEISYLLFLQNYTRVGTPTNIEREAWNKINHENPSLPLISKWRLPFLTKSDKLLKLITPELNVKTYEHWLRIAPVLKLSIYSICPLAVRESVPEAWKLTSSSVDQRNKWALTSRYSSLLKDIKKCIERMPGVQGLEYGTAAWYHVVNHIPPGADRVAAANECFAHLQRWQQAAEGFIDTTQHKIPKIKEKYLRYTTMHILYTHGLGDDNYLSLIDDPEKLVRILYQDKTIPQRYKSACCPRPDINSAVSAIVNISDLNLRQIGFELLQEWLKPDNYDSKINDSLTMNLHSEITTTSNDTFTTDDNLLRACYLVDSDNAQDFVNHLIHIGFSDDTMNRYSPGQRFRALRIIQSITDEVSLKASLKRDVSEINQYVKSLQYVTELERLGLGYSVSGFDKYSKDKLVQILIDNQRCSPEALGLITHLYVDYSINDIAVLNTALERMVQFSLVQQLKRTLRMLGSMDRIINCNGYLLAWQAVIDESFKKLDILLSPEITANCIDTLRLIDICPVVDKLDFRKIIEKCFTAQQLHLAATFISLQNHNNREELLKKKIIQSGQYDDIKIKLMELSNKGILMIRQAMLLLRSMETILTNGN